MEQDVLYICIVGEWNKMAEILLEKMEVPALYLANKSVMALYGGGQMTGEFIGCILLDYSFM